MSSPLPGFADAAPIVVVVGNPRPGSRTAALARRLADRIAAETDVSAPPAVIDLAELTEAVGPPLGSDSAERYAGPLSALHAARLVIVATPTYKGSYTGLLKSFLDHVGGGALHGITAVPVTTVGSPAHTLAADVHLRPLLVELGASTSTSALVAGNDQLGEPDGVIAAWVELNRPFLVAALPAEAGSGARS